MALITFIAGIFLGAYLTRNQEVIIQKPLAGLERKMKKDEGTVIGQEEMNQLDLDDLKEKIRERGQDIPLEELEDME